MPSSLIAHGASRFTIILRLSVAMATLCLAAHPAALFSKSSRQWEILPELMQIGTHMH